METLCNIELKIYAKFTSISPLLCKNIYVFMGIKNERK